jgi:hypothetical protein
MVSTDLVVSPHYQRLPNAPRALLFMQVGLLVGPLEASTVLGEGLGRGKDTMSDRLVLLERVLFDSLMQNVLDIPGGAEWVVDGNALAVFCWRACQIP